MNYERQIQKKKKKIFFRKHIKIFQKNTSKQNKS